jgi:hypothetical protein
MRVDVLRPPIPAIETIFEIFSSEEVKEGDFEIDTSEDRIKIIMGEKTFGLVQSLREGDLSTRAVVMNGLYVPVVMQVLHQLSDDQDQFSQCRWFEPFKKRCELLDVDLTSSELLTNAQRLLDSPFVGLGRLVQDVEPGDE